LLLCVSTLFTSSDSMLTMWYCMLGKIKVS
jgi:hypothetical protein